MARYTQESVERARDAVDMADLVGSRTELRRSGVNQLQGLCPFHDERSPSLSVDAGKKLFHCFGCGEGGTEVDFVMKLEGLDFKSAIEYLADRYNVQLELEDEDPAAAQRRARRERLQTLLDRTATFYERVLWESKEAQAARTYLLERGLTEEALKTYRVGYAPSAWDTVLMRSQQAGFSKEELFATGLAKRNQQGTLYDQFRSRITFPLSDSRGRVIGFGARQMSQDRGPKYLNTPESELFHKGRIVYGAHLARSAAAKAGSVIVTEGYTDVIALHQAGFANAVCIMGTSMTEEQVKVLRRLAPVAHLALDADNAGQEAMIRAARVARGEQLELRVLALPQGLDPADLVARDGADAVHALVERSMPFVRFRVKRVLASGDLSTAEGKDDVLDELRPVMADLPQSVLREELMRLIADQLNLTPELAAQLIAQPPRRRPPEPERRGGSSRGAPERGGFGPQRAAHGRPMGDTGAPRPRTPAGAPGGGFGDPGGERPPIEDFGFEDPGSDAPPYGGNGGGGGSAPPGRRGSGSDLAAIVAREEEVERRFLAFCVGQPGIGAEALRRIDPEEHFTSALNRRAAAHLRDHLEDPIAGLADDDHELRSLLTELTVRASGEPGSAATLDVQRLQLELRRLDRRLAAVRASGEGGAHDLAVRRQEVKNELDAAMIRAVEAA
jgi:DNA primase